MSPEVAQEEISPPAAAPTEEEKNLNRDSTGSNTSNSDSSMAASGESLTNMTIHPEQAINNTPCKSQHLDPSSALPLTNPRKQRSTGILSLRRSASGSRQRSGSLSANAAKPELLPPLPTKREPEQPPKSILSPSSSSSSLSHSATTSPSLSRSPSIQFAPLPQLAPRKRKSTIPLGIAARSAMMQRRRQIMYGTSAAANIPNTQAAPDTLSTNQSGGGMWTAAENEEHIARQLRSKEKEREKMFRKQQKELEKDAMISSQGNGHPSGVEMENDDPLVVFGRLMKDAWRKVGKKDSKSTKSKAKAEAQTMTQTETTQDTPTITNDDSPAPDEPLDSVSVSNHPSLETDEIRSVPHEPSTPIENNEPDDDELHLDPNEVDITKIVPLRSGSPPPSHHQSASQLSESHSESSSVTGSDETAGSASTMTSPSATNPPSPTTPTASTVTHTSNSDKQNVSKDIEEPSPAIVHSEQIAHRLPSLELTPLSPFLVT
ncbi:hypothetical protein FB446DRAFT_487036 [Lentinula raphanica]|nr:hypothetical protein FB446DRAFT_487036 [Lentinula raphanica]